MSLKNDRYTYRVTWSDDDNEYVGLCAEFPSLSWLASTPEAALKGIRKVVADIVEDIRNTILQCGGEIHFNAKLTDIALDQHQKIKALIISPGEERGSPFIRQLDEGGIFLLHGILYLIPKESAEGGKHISQL